MNLIQSLNKNLEIKEENLESMIIELMEREEFSGGSSGGSCTGVACPSSFVSGGTNCPEIYYCASGFSW